MKLTSSIFILTAALAFSACSDDDSKAPKDTSKITFTVSVPKAPRKPVTTESITDFRTWGFVNGKPYMEDVEVSKNENGSWQYNPAQYWPADSQKVNFYSYSPSIVTETPNTPDNPDIPGYVNRDGTTDLLYGVNIGETGRSRVVKINFRHALSQVIFQFKRMAPPATPRPLKVNVQKVELLNIYTTGSFDFPDATTAAGDNTVGTWKDQTNLTCPVLYEGSAVLTDDPTELNTTKYMFSIPQVLVQSTVTGNNYQNVTNYQGAYVRILCDIYDEKTDIKLWPSTTDSNYDNTTGAGYIYFPLNGENSRFPQWELGKSYRYTMTVGVPDDGAGYIDFNVTVDNYSEFE